jgi:Ferroportin1 (FPN1)
MTAYLKSLGMTEAVLSLFRGVGAVAGVAATFTYPLLHRRIGALVTLGHDSKRKTAAGHEGRACSIPMQHVRGGISALADRASHRSRAFLRQTSHVCRCKLGLQWSACTPATGGLRAGLLGVWGQAACLWIAIAPSLAPKLGVSLPASLVRIPAYNMDILCTSEHMDGRMDGQLCRAMPCEGYILYCVARSTSATLPAGSVCSIFTTLTAASADHACAGVGCRAQSLGPVDLRPRCQSDVAGASKLMCLIGFNICPSSSDTFTLLAWYW